MAMLKSSRGIALHHETDGFSVTATRQGKGLVRLAVADAGT